MKNLLVLLPTAAALVGTTLAAPLPARADMKVGVVDMNKVFQAYWKTKEAETKINEQKAAAQSEFNAQMDSYRKTLEEIQQLNKELENRAINPRVKDEKASDRDKKIQESQQQQRELQSFQQTRERQIQEQIVRERNHIVEDIMRLVQDKVKAESFDLVFDKSGNSVSMVPLVLFSRDNMEFSDEIIRSLNRSRPPETPNAPTAAAPAAPAPRAAGGATPAPAAPPRRP